MRLDVGLYGSDVRAAAQNILSFIRNVFSILNSQEFSIKVRTAFISLNSFLDGLPSSATFNERNFPSQQHQTTPLKCIIFDLCTI